MSQVNVSETEARAALEAVARSRQRVIDEIDMPRWYWIGLAAAWVVLGVLTDLGHPWLTAAATLVFGAAHAAVSQLVVGGRHRTTQLSVRADVAGHRAPLVVVAAIVGLAALTVGAALVADADGARHPVTMASVLVAALIVFGGPQLMASIRRHAAQPATPS
jgi:hypothetical protein